MNIMNLFPLFSDASFFAGINFVLLIVLLGTSVWFDVKSRRIPNWLIAMGLTASFALQVLSSFGSFSTWGMGLLAGFGLFIPFYLLRAMGAGDVKLMAVIGSFIGPGAALSAVLLTLVAGGVMAICVSLWGGAFRSVLSNVRLLLTSTLFSMLHGKTATVNATFSSAGNLPYALAIATGTLAHLILAHSGRALFA